MKEGGLMKKYTANVFVKDELKEITNREKDKPQRIIGEELKDYLFESEDTKVCILYGLRRTGKTTLMLQTISELTQDEFEKSAYIEVSNRDTISSLYSDLDRLKEEGYKYIFIDEVTSLDNFISMSSLFPDVYVRKGLRIVLTGTDSLDFFLSSSRELYDRARYIHTTYIPFYEFKHLFPNKNIDEFIEYGGTLIPEYNEDYPFYNGKNAEQYVDSAIAQNIQHSLENYEEGSKFRSLINLYNQDKLTNAINRVVQNRNHQFSIRVIQSTFKPSDYNSVRDIMTTRVKKNIEPNTDILNKIDSSTIVEPLKKQLHIYDARKDEILTDSEVYEIEQYLRKLEIVDSYTVESGDFNISPVENNIITQSGLRYSQCKELLKILENHNTFRLGTDKEQNLIVSTIDNNVKGKILEELTIYNVQQSLDAEKYEVFQLSYPPMPSEGVTEGEIDLVIKDKELYTVELFEIKHSSEIVPSQYKHMIDPAKMKYFEKRGLEVTGRTVLYMGKTQGQEIEGVKYKNISEYLDELKVYDRNYQKMLLARKECIKNVEDEYDDNDSLDTKG